MADPPSWRELSPLRRARIRFWLEAVGSSAPVEQVERTLAQLPRYAAIATAWSTLDELGLARAAGELDELFRQAAYATRPFCLRCGQCCANAGPTLYPGDEHHVLEGRIARSRLVTYRAGEQVYSHAKQRTMVLTDEHVAVASRPNEGCTLLDVGSKCCTVYEHRPLQCVEQRCWAEERGRALARRRGLDRAALLPAESPVLTVIEEHERRCASGRLWQLVEAQRSGSSQARADIQAMVDEDERLRRRMIALAGASAAELPFLLGRPLADQLGAAVSLSSA